MSSIVTTLSEDYLLFIYLCFYAVFISLRLLYHSDGDILLVLLRQLLILAVSLIFSFTSVSPTFPFFCCFAPGRFARFHVRPESFRSQPFIVLFRPTIDFIKMFQSAITFVIDADISFYSSLHSVENVLSHANINVPLCLTYLKQVHKSTVCFLQILFIALHHGTKYLIDV